MSDTDFKPSLFFLVVAPSFEKLALYELIRCLKANGYQIEDYTVFPGGIEVRLPMEVGLALNSVLKIPTRILLRLASREALSEQDLVSFFKSFNWDQYLPLRTVYVSSRSSRLKMKEDIKELFQKTIRHKTSKTGTDVYIRMFRDICTLSIDTSGEDLFVRGEDKWVGQAPIRDTMAAGLLQLALQGEENLDDWEVVDPMMGAGTFLLEALRLSRVSKRSFVFQNWKDAPIPVQLKVHQSLGLAVRGMDKAPKMIEISRKNLTAFGLKDPDVRAEDLFRGESVVKTTRPKRLVILNPPYGVRLSVNDQDFFDKVVERCDEKFSPDRVGIVVPKGAAPRASAGLEKVRHLEFSNNGIDVEFYLFMARNSAK